MSTSSPPLGVPSLPPNVVVFGPRANCTLEICPVQSSVYGYRPSLAANLSFIALYTVASLIHVYLGIRWKQWWFMACMLVGAANAVIGYAGRVMMYYNPFNFAAFMLQISEHHSSLLGRAKQCQRLTSGAPVCITTGPVYYCAAVYITLALT